MKISEIIEAITLHNKWRKGDDSITMTDPIKLGKVLDEACTKLRDLEQFESSLEEYNGPVAGKSSHEEWIAVRDYQAFKWVRNGVWGYSDFDCYIYSMCAEMIKRHESLSKDNTLNGN